MIVPRYYEDFHMLHENTMPERAYYIPASKRMDTLVEQRENSDRIQMLNGEWKFRYYKSIYELKETFYKMDYDFSSFDQIQVPSVWQMAGYDRHQYTNIRYPFPFDPPYVPQENPCGIYIYEFDYQKDSNAPKAYLNFEGVDSCFYVWLNGTYIGYSQVSHSTSEFDVSHMITEGKNKLAVLVLKWCDGSYLEDQDKFRMSGIFRDVYLLKRPKQGVRDYFIKTDIGKETANIQIKVQYFEELIPTIVTIYNQDNQIVAETEIKNDIGIHQTDITMEISSPILWNTEKPYLYTLVIETKSETIVDHIGLREIYIKDNIVYFNGEKIKFRGVNRHDSDPVTGFTISLSQMKKDLMLMKQHNFNAIRTSHYPNAPVFYQLCDKYGFMIINEADIESHGPIEFFYRDNSDINKFHHWNESIADNPDWEMAILDRVKLCVQRDKNRPCVVIWSMGNESAYGCNFEKALEWTKKFDNSRLTHYESARYRNPKKIYDYSYLDLYSRMYPSLEEIKDYLKRATKPLILCEYCHSMGNGPGDLEDYFKIITENDSICGGFVWEWCDHAVAHKTKDGKTIYSYGGDHGEELHDGNFCMDGLVYPNRTRHTGLLEYKNVYRPFRVISFDQNTQKLTLKNYMEFTDLEEYAEINYEVNCDGSCIETGVIPAFSIKSQQIENIYLNITIPKMGRSYLKLYYHLLKKTELIPSGHLLGFDEILLKTEDMRNQVTVKWLEKRKNFHQKSATIEVQETDSEIICKGNEFIYSYNKSCGLFTQISYAGQAYLDKPMELNIWRAPVDNDMYIKQEWKRAHYHQTYTRAYNTTIDKTETMVRIFSTMSLLASSLQRILDIHILWLIDCNGGIYSEIAIKRNMEFPMLPRFGIRLFLNEKFDHVFYYGMGPYESYQDKHRASSHNLYHAKVQDLHEDYLRPQENGSHMDCDYVVIKSNQLGLAAASYQPFSFQASIYTQEELEKKAHNYELEPSGSTILCLDYEQNGLGSNSCGPELRKKYRLDKEEFTFCIKLVPFAKEE